MQAAIAAVHAEAPHPDATDWPQIAALYEVLTRLAPSPIVTLNHAVALGVTHGPAVGLALLDELSADERIAGHHRGAAVRAHGDTDAARQSFAEASRQTTSVPERRYLTHIAPPCSGDVCQRPIP